MRAPVLLAWALLLALLAACGADGPPERPGAADRPFALDPDL